MFTEFETLDLTDIQYILRGFNIYLLQKEMHSCIHTNNFQRTLENILKSVQHTDLNNR